MLLRKKGMSVHQKLGIIVESKVVQKLSLENFFGRNPKCDRDWIKVQREKGK